MKFSAFAFASLVATTSTVVPAGAKLTRGHINKDPVGNNSGDEQSVVQRLLDKVDELQEQIADLKDEVDNNGNGDTLHYRSSPSGVYSNTRARGRRARMKNRGRKLSTCGSKSLGKGSKKGFSSVCWGSGGNVTAQTVNYMLQNKNVTEEAIDIGLVRTADDEGIMIDVTASTMTYLVVGGLECNDPYAQGCFDDTDEYVQRKLTPQEETPRELTPEGKTPRELTPTWDVDGSNWWVSGAGVYLKPVVSVCDDHALSECCADEIDCIRDACSGYQLAVEPETYLPLKVEIVGGEETLHDFSVGDGDSSSYVEFDKEKSSNNVRFFVPSAEVAGRDVYVKLVVTAFALGAGDDGTTITKTTLHSYCEVCACSKNWCCKWPFCKTWKNNYHIKEYSNLEVASFQKAKAELGPHLIEVSTMKSMESQCAIYEEYEDV